MTPIGKILLAVSGVLPLILLPLDNAGMLPLGVGDFLFFLIVFVLAALYRPGWVFLGLVSSIPLETVSLAPEIFGVALHPYQFFEITLFLGLFGRLLSRRVLPTIPKFHLIDIALSLVLVGSIFSLVNAPDPGDSFKLSLVLVSFFGLYVLGRLYLQSFEDVKRILPFILVSGTISMAYAVFQNIRFLSGLDPFEVMPGRPNAAFPEPDWFGAFLVALSGFFFHFWISVRKTDSQRMLRYGMSFFLSTLLFVSLLLSVTRSAWLAVLVSGSVFFVSVFFFHADRSAWKWLGIGVPVSFFASLLLVLCVPLTTFDLSGRAVSTAGLQEITISCEREVTLPETIGDISELSSFGCRHIDLEEIDSERGAGMIVSTIDRPDPNVETRKNIYAISWEKIKEHPILGIGWGSIGSFLGADSRGASLNASNLFLETWLGSGILGIIGFFVAWASLPVVIFRKLFRFRTYESFDAVMLSSWAGLTVCNLFNSGLLLGFMWIFLCVSAVVVSGDQGEE